MDNLQLLRKQSIEANIYPGRVLIVYGPRRVGKTTLLKKYLANQTNKKVFFSTGDDIVIRGLFLSQVRADLLAFAKDYDVIAIDEAQQIPYIGLGIKMIIDGFPEKQIILTGSSSFELSQKAGEPLTGRHFVLNLLPFSIKELGLGDFEIKSRLENFLIFGNYPEVLRADTHEDKKKILSELISSYLFKDILALDKVRSPDALLSLVKALAYQIGQEVSASEIANLVKLDVKTVQRYIDILEKMFVIKKVKAYAKNNRNEIAKKNKYYFLDLGVRNAVINQYNKLEDRNDVGQLFENFVFLEFLKKDNLLSEYNNFYFWRNFAKQEVDLVLEKDGLVRGFECKYSRERISIPSSWQEESGNYKLYLVNKNNFLDYLEY